MRIDDGKMFLFNSPRRRAIMELKNPLIFAGLNFAAPVWRKGFVNETIRGGG
jgi:hypothetical protein